MNIVFLNLADKQGALAKKSVRSLRKKYPAYTGWNPFYYFSSSNHTIHEVDLIPIYEQWSAGQTDLALARRVIEIERLCSQADKVMLGIHGHFDDPTCGYIEDFGTTSKTITYSILARFLLFFLENRSTRFHLALVMCFGARSGPYLLDHTRGLPTLAVKGSFAYKFHKLICTQRNILMTARTGAVSFSETDGKSLVQTEGAVLAEVEYEDLQDAREVHQLREVYEGLKEQAFQRGSIKSFLAMEARVENELQKGRTDWSMASGPERVILDYLRVKAEVGRLTQAKDVSSGKYGKFVYRYSSNDGRITVTRKYPHNEVLYRGAL